jgi:hypothetical protein
MSNSVVFLLIAVGLSVLGTTAVWLHGRPRRSRRESADLGATLRALSATHKPPASRSAPGSRGGAQPPTDDTAGAARRDPRPSREARPGT